MAGWIKIYRDLNDHWLSQDMEKLGRWVSLLLLATHDDYKAMIGDSLVTLKRGQVATSFSSLAKRWNCSKSTASKFIELLESDKMVERKCERKTTILTICNYESYQVSENQSPNDCRTIAERLPNDCRTKTRTKEHKEYIDNTKAHAYTREETFVQQYRQENRWAEAAMMAHLKLDQVKSIFEEFLIEQNHNSTTHADYPDFKRHFLNYLRTKAEILRKQAKDNNNGTQRKYDDRRGTEVSSSADYFEPL